MNAPACTHKHELYFIHGYDQITMYLHSALLTFSILKKSNANGKLNRNHQAI